MGNIAFQFVKCIRLDRTTRVRVNTHLTSFHLVCNFLIL
jgi:hypothetical protein